MQIDKSKLQILINKGLAVADLGDGAWGWTDLGKKTLPPQVRTILSNSMWGEQIFPWEKHFLNWFQEN